MLKVRVMLATVTLLVSACGVSVDRHPRDIPAQQVPFELVTPTSSTTVAAPRERVAAEVFFLRDGRLESAGRQVTAPATIGTVLASLAQGPTAEERERGLTSAVNEGTRVLSAEVANGAAVVNVSDSFSRIGVRNQIMALAQIVYTATALTGVDRVQVMLDGEAVQVPRGDGTSAMTALRRADYPGFAPLSR